jgi:hypothetical protein
MSRARRESARAADELFRSLAPKRRAVQAPPIIVADDDDVRVNFTIRTLAGTQVACTFRPTDTVRHVKEHVSTVFPGVTPDHQRLLRRERLLDDSLLLEDYYVRDGDTIELHFVVHASFDAPPVATAAAAKTVAFTLRWAGATRSLVTSTAPTGDAVLVAARREFVRLGAASQPSWRSVRAIAVDGHLITAPVVVPPIARVTLAFPECFSTVEFI